MTNVKKNDVVELLEKVRISVDEEHDESKSEVGSVVTVTGDRGEGVYMVRLVTRLRDLEQDETLYLAVITKLVDNKYDYKIGDVVAVVRDTGDSYWGTIDPFVFKS